MQQPSDNQRMADTLLRSSVETLSEHERHVLQQIVERQPVSRNMNQSFDEGLTFGQRLADRVAAFGGSWMFIILFGTILICWIGLNTFVLATGTEFDPYPYILLNLMLSMLAALEAPVILMSQNRQSAKDRQDAEHDYEVNLKAELEISSLHNKLDHLRDDQWAQLIEVQHEQIRLLTQLLSERYPAPSGDPS